MTLFFALACSPPPYTPPTEDSEGGTPSCTEPTEAELSVRTLWPKPESTQTACAMFVFDVGEFSLVDFRVNETNVPNQGHLHVYWADTYQTCIAPYCLVEFGEIPEENYSFTVSMANNDHSDLLDDDGNVISTELDLHVVPGTCTASVEGLE